MYVIIIGEKEVLETIPEGCTCSMFRNRNPFRQAVYTTACFIKTGKERGGYGRKRHYDHGTDFGISDCVLRCTLLADDEGV